VKSTKGRPGKHSNLNPYNSGIYDLCNSLGHFDVVITERKGSRLKTYEIQDRFGPPNKAVGQDAIKGVNWLTLLDNAFIESLGGLSQVKHSVGAGVDYVDLEGGTILKAGELPATGDTNRGDFLPLYKQVYRSVRPLVEIATERSVAFNLEEDFVEKTEAWFRRFADE
jgi:Protein of unknown function (DUF3396)